MILCNVCSGFTKLNLDKNRLWTKSSWLKKKSYDTIPKYFNSTIYDHVTEKLQKSSPIIFAKESRILQEELAEVCIGKSFLLIGGDCAETFQDSNIDKIWKDFRLFLQMSLILTFGLEKPIVKIARIGGQYAKPRSNLWESKNNIMLPSYQGDIINSPEFEKEKRLPNPMRMLHAYHLSIQTVNILRAFIQGGYTEIYNHEMWNTLFPIKDHVYHDVIQQLKKSLQFMKALKISSESNKNLRDINLYTGHEALLLPYEECFVRNDSLTFLNYDCSAHFLWIGERTRQLDGQHIEFIRGISNPIGVKISEKITPDELLEMTYILNPDNIPGRLTFIIRMGVENLELYLPSLIDIIKQNNRNVIWVTDPMHANTIMMDDGNKTRYFNDIWNEIFTFFKIHKEHNSYPGGIHLEMTGQNVTECIGGFIEPILRLNNYKSVMDPRLNSLQSIEIALLLSQHFKN
jgi:3-deoxy-7-phosphoheptulonate synthase